MFLPVVLLLGARALLAEYDGKYDGTTGIPLGGIGTGGIKFCSWNGNFYRSFSTPVLHDNYPALANTQFQFYSKRGSTIATDDKLTAVLANGRYDDDAIYPAQFANFGTINGCTVKLTACAPFDLTGGNKMAYPLAFFEIEVANTQSTAVDAACALLLGYGSQVSEAGKGIRCTDALGVAVYAKSSDAAAVVSMGKDNGFFTAGQCDNAVSGSGNRVAVKFTLAANEKKTVKFVYAWYNGPNPTWYYYTSVFANLAAVADFGLANFDSYRNNAVNFATRFQASSLPRWLKSYMMKMAAMFVYTTIYTQDKRMCVWEGHDFEISGTLDQNWHSNFLLNQLAPDIMSQQLEDFARAQKRTNNIGQINHDFGTTTQINAWDNDADGSYPTGLNWVDLNAGFIINCYELIRATGNQQKFDYFWPYMKRAASRTMQQLRQMQNSSYPCTFSQSGSTYDNAGTAQSDYYNSGLTPVAWKIMTMLGQRKGESAAFIDTYKVAFETANSSFTKRYLTNNFPGSQTDIEALMSGQWTSYSLNLGEMYPTTNIDYGTTSICNIIKADTSGIQGGDWVPYTMSHYAGLLLNAGRANDWYNAQYYQFREMYADRNNAYKEPWYQWWGVNPRYPADDATCYTYCSAPVQIRNYFNMIGYNRDKLTGELWLEPILPPQIGHTMTDALYYSPEGLGTISYTESGTGYQMQNILFKPDNPIPVKIIYVRDKGLNPAFLSINGVQKSFERIGAGHAKELKIAWDGTVPSTGLNVVVSNVPVHSFVPITAAGCPASFVRYDKVLHSLVVRSQNAGVVKVFGLNGALMHWAKTNAGTTSIALPAAIHGWCAVNLTSAGIARNQVILIGR